jgi:hypothetical protein
MRGGREGESREGGRERVGRGKEKTREGVFMWEGAGPLERRGSLLTVRRTQSARRVLW